MSIILVTRPLEDHDAFGRERESFYAALGWEETE